MGFVRRNISITQLQDRFLRDTNISLSKLIQKTVDKEMESLKFAAITKKNYEEMENGNYEEMDMGQFLDEAENW